MCTKQKYYIHEDKYNKLKRFFTITYALGLLALTLILLVFVNSYCGISNMNDAIIITLYSYVILFLVGIVELFKTNRFIKIGIDSFFTGLYFVGLGYVLTNIFNENMYNYKINLLDWNNNINGNVCFLLLLSFITVSIVFIILGIKNKNNKV